MADVLIKPRSEICSDRRRLNPAPMCWTPRAADNTHAVIFTHAFSNQPESPLSWFMCVFFSPFFGFSRWWRTGRASAATNDKLIHKRRQKYLQFRVLLHSRWEQTSTWTLISACTNDSGLTTCNTCLWFLVTLKFFPFSCNGKSRFARIHFLLCETEAGDLTQMYVPHITLQKSLCSAFTVCLWFLS